MRTPKIGLKLKIPPLAQAILAAVLIWLLNRYLPLLQVRFEHQRLVAAAFIGMGALVALSGVTMFMKMGTTVDPRHPENADELVVVGIYRYTRNPMYVGILAALIGMVIYFGSVSTLMVLPMFVAAINKLQIVPEEIALEEKFGKAYRDYIRNVRRWI